MFPMHRKNEGNAETFPDGRQQLECPEPAQHTGSLPAACYRGLVVCEKFSIIIYEKKLCAEF